MVLWLVVVASAVATFPWWGVAATGAVTEQRLAPLRWAAAALAGAALTLLLTRSGPLQRAAELSRRIDEFQRRLRYELARTPGRIETPTWRDRLGRLRREAERTLSHGLGRGTRRWRRRRAALLDDAWAQVVAIVEQRARGDSESSLDGSGLDALIRRTLAGASATPAAAAVAGGDTGAARTGAVADRSTEPAAGGAPPTARPTALGVAGPAEAATVHHPMRRGVTVVTAPAPSQPNGSRQGRPSPASPAAPATEPIVCEAAAFAEAVAATRRSVAYEDGVYRVREELYGPALRPSLRQMAEGAITDDKLERLVAAGRRHEGKIPVTAQGIRCDRLLARYPDSREPAIRTRVLEGLRQSLDAAGAALLRREDGAYRMALAVGSLGVLAESCELAAGNPVYDDHLRSRRCLVVESGSAGRAWERYSTGLDAVEWGDGGRLAFLPAILDAAAAYLLLADAAPLTAAPGGGAWDLTTLITRLNLHP